LIRKKIKKFGNNKNLIKTFFLGLHFQKIISPLRQNSTLKRPLNVVVIKAASWKVIQLGAPILVAWACTFQWGVLQLVLQNL
jgi:hypothetical protein